VSVLIELCDQAFSIGTSCDSLRRPTRREPCPDERLRQVLSGKALREGAGGTPVRPPPRKLSLIAGNGAEVVETAASPSPATEVAT
jgi:hypothetical protein